MLPVILVSWLGWIYLYSHDPGRRSRALRLIRIVGFRDRHGCCPHQTTRRHPSVDEGGNNPNF